MILPDVNVLVSAFAEESVEHQEHRAWLDTTLEDGKRIVLADLVVSGLLRIATDRRIFARPASFDEAIAFVDSLFARSNVQAISAGDRHWPIFRNLIRESRATGQLVPDVHIASLAVEHGCRVATGDRDFARFPAVEWFDPLG